MQYTFRIHKHIGTVNGRDGEESCGHEMFSIVIIYALQLKCKAFVALNCLKKFYVLRHFTAFIFVLNCIRIFKCKVMFRLLSYV